MLFDTKTDPAIVSLPHAVGQSPTLAERSTNFWLLLVGGLALIGWAFFSTLDLLVEKWINDPQYSHGFLVPLFSLYLLRRSMQSGQSMFSYPLPVVAALLLVPVIGIRYLAGGLLLVQLDAFAMLLSLSALALVVGGMRMARASAPAVLFLIFMVPLPYELERNVGGPLKIVATESSTFLLQTLGYPAVSEGNIILIDEVRLGVIDACSGLKMLMTFSAFAVGAVLTLDRTWFEKLLVLMGIVPIAVIANVLRIVATGIVYTMTTNEETRRFAHDRFGLVMMPLGLGLLAVQLWVLGRLVVRPTQQTPLHEPYTPSRPAAPMMMAATPRPEPALAAV